ncbi:MAG: ABC transporter substrate-binding protein/permease [Clostridia bacterium]|nr:ABC transporter substrate-binding protein/permease [Clostridia bacterium]
MKNTTFSHNKNHELRKRFLCFLAVVLTVICVSAMFSGCSAKQENGTISRVSDLNKEDITIGGLTGSAHEPMIAEVFPNAQEKQFNSIGEMQIALEHGQIDAFVHARESLDALVEEKKNTYRVLDNIGDVDCGMAISPKTKYSQLENQLNEFLKGMQDSGELAGLYQKWMIDKNYEMPDIPLADDSAETLVVGTSGELVPNSFYEGDKLVGYDIELTLQFAYEYNYKVEFRAESITSRLNDAEFGKVDMLSGGILKTPERAEKVIFPETPVYTAPVGVLILDKGDTVKPGFFENILTAFDKTLIRENRWKMILNGLGVTMLLSVGTLVLGSLLGFVFCILKRSKIKGISKLMNAFISLIDGIPTVLVLMICFYIVFADTGLKEIPVAIIAFSISFACRAAVILDTGMNSVASGEVEAAEAMGMSSWQVFRKILFPQAVLLAFDMYKSQVVAMIKNTSVVGFIAVQDLTKVSDIIRARTYESFFSLMFTALIYFLIARIFLWLLTLVGNKMNPRRKAKRLTEKKADKNDR